MEKNITDDNENFQTPKKIENAVLADLKTNRSLGIKDAEPKLTTPMVHKLKAPSKYKEVYVLSNPTIPARPNEGQTRNGSQKSNYFEINIPVVYGRNELEQLRMKCKKNKAKREQPPVKGTTNHVTAPTTSKTYSTTEASLNTSFTAFDANTTAQLTNLQPDLATANTSNPVKINQTKFTIEEILKAVEFEIEPIDLVKSEEIAKIKIIKHKKSKRKYKSRKDESKSQKQKIEEKYFKSTSNESNKAQETVSIEKKISKQKSSNTQTRGRNSDRYEKTETNIQSIAMKTNKTHTDINPASPNIASTDKYLPTSIDNVQTSFESLELSIKDNTSGSPSEKTKREVDPSSGLDEDLENTPLKRAIETTRNSVKENLKKKLSIKQHNQLQSEKHKADATEERAERVNQAMQKLLTLVNALAQVDSYLTNRAKLGVRKLAKIFEIDEELEKQERMKRKSI